MLYLNRQAARTCLFLFIHLCAIFFLMEGCSSSSSKLEDLGISRVQVTDKDGSYPFTCSIIQLVRTQGKILGVFRFSNNSGKTLYAKPNPFFAGGPNSFNFLKAFLLNNGHKYYVVEGFPSKRGFGNMAYLPGKMDVTPNVEIFSLWFDNIPKEVKNVSVVLPLVDPFENVPVSLPKPQFRVKTERPNVMCAIKKVEMTKQSMQITLEMVETAGRMVLLWPNLQLILFRSEVFKPEYSSMVAGGKAYKVLSLESKDGKTYLATKFERGTMLSPRQSLEFWIKFPRPNPEAKTFTLLVPNCEPFIDIPISGPPPGKF
jgi:hypothetical protein